MKSQQNRIELVTRPGHSPEQRRIKLSGLRLTARIALGFRIRHAHSVRSRRRGLWHGSLRTSHQHGGGSHQRRDASHTKVRRSSGPYRGDCDGGREGTVGSPDTDRSLVTYPFLFCWSFTLKDKRDKVYFQFVKISLYLYFYILVWSVALISEVKYERRLQILRFCEHSIEGIQTFLTENKIVLQ